MRKLTFAVAAVLVLAGCSNSAAAPEQPHTAITQPGVDFVPAWEQYLQDVRDGKQPTDAECDPKTWQDLILPTCDVGGK